jgi:hypothetical protein
MIHVGGSTMTQTLETTQPLTTDERRQVQDYAEFLISRRESRAATAQDQRPNRINVDALIGMFAGMGGDKSNKELIREAWDEIAAKYD